MPKIFNQVGFGRRPGRNKFDLSHERKLSFNMGAIIPILCNEVVPGDSFRVRSEVMMRFAPMLAPIMHRVNVKTEYFFVPNRLIWDEWEEFITGGREGSSTPVTPHIAINTTNVGLGHFAQGTLADYFGLPPIADSVTVTQEQTVSALPFRAYQLIYDEYYRDQNLEPSLDISKASGLVDFTETGKLCTTRNRAWEKDYFTSALPWAQRGPSALIPIEGDGDVSYHSTSQILAAGSGNLINTDQLLGTTAGSPGQAKIKTGLADAGSSVRVENIDEVTFENTTVTVNELRRSIKLQQWLEKMARGGARYVEQMLVMFGVKSSDARLQRPEFLGGGRTPVVVSEVLSTFQEETGNPTGSMAGHGISVGTQNGFKRSFEEHGFIIGVMSVLPRTAYQQGISRMWTREDKFDYYWPDFATIGEQEVKQRELYYDPTGASAADGTFGYQSRYCEYKFESSTVHGDFRDSLAFWHMGRIFDSAPALNSDFVKSDPTTRIFAVEGGDHLWCQLYNQVHALRPMPYFGTPSI